MAGTNGPRDAERTTHGEFLRLMKNRLGLKDEQMTTYMRLLKECRPDFNANESLPTTGRGLAGKAHAYARKYTIRKVDDGYTHDDYPKLHTVPQLSATPARLAARGVRRKALGVQHKPIQKQKKKTRKTKKKKTKKSFVRKGMGDVADFGIENCLFLDGPGNVHTWEHRCMLRRINAAKPSLLSPGLLKVADEKAYEDEISKGLLAKRPPQNYISLKVFVDGVQICENGQLPQAIPIAATIDTIAAYDPETMRIDWENSVRVPFRHSKPFLISVYHGLKKPDLFQFFEPFFTELMFLDPFRKVQDPEQRKCVVQLRTMICDSPMVSSLTGT